MAKKTYNYGVSLTYRGRRYVWGNGTNYFGDFTLAMAKSIALSLNHIVREKEGIFKKPIKARPVKIYHGSVYSVLEKKGKKIMIVKRTHK
ncbi:MAG: hypothetical protein WCT85_01560 [Parachlamydiales bacterium]|jgi:hypothetical protein